MVRDIPGHQRQVPYLLDLFSPGRFLAITTVKTVVAYILLNYDMKLDASKPVPDYWLASFASPTDPKVEVYFRRRG